MLEIKLFVKVKLYTIPMSLITRILHLLIRLIGNRGYSRDMM